LSTEKEILKIRPTAFVIGIIAVVLMTVFMSWMTGFVHSGFIMDWTQVPYDTVNWSFITFAFFWVWIVCLLTSGLGKYFNNAERLLISAMLYVSFLIPTWYSGVVGFITYGGIVRKMPSLDWWYALSKGTAQYFSPDVKDETIWLHFFSGGGSVPWNAWALPIAYGIAYFSAFLLTWYFVGALFRRQWIEVENLPFPMATGTISVIRLTESKPNLVKNVPLWIGIVIGIIGQAQFWLPFFVPALAFPTNNVPGWDFTYLTYTALPWVPVHLSFSPWLIGAFFLIPTSILLTYIVFALAVWWVLSPTLAYAGVIAKSGPGPANHFYYHLGRMGWGAIDVNKLGNAGFAYYWIGVGGAIGLVFFPVLVTYRRETARVLKSIFVRRDKDLEKNEPFSYRTMTLLLLLSFIAWFVVLSVGSGGVSSSFPFVFSAVAWMIGTMIFHSLAASRVSGEFGLATNWAMGFVPLYQSEFRLKASFEGPFAIQDRTLRAQWLRATTFGDIDYMNSPGDPAPFALDMFKAGQELGAPSRYLYLGMAVSIVVAVIVTFFAFTSFAYMYGFDNKWSNYGITGWLGFWPHYSGFNPVLGAGADTWSWNSPRHGYNWIYGVSTGLILTVILFILRARFPWFPLHPAGPALAFSAVNPQALFPAIIAYVAKRLIIRTRGVSWYEQKAVPFAIGLVIGLSLSILLANFTRISRVLVK